MINQNKEQSNVSLQESTIPIYQQLLPSEIKNKIVLKEQQERMSKDLEEELRKSKKRNYISRSVHRNYEVYRKSAKLPTQKNFRCLRIDSVQDLLQNSYNSINSPQNFSSIVDKRDTINMAPVNNSKTNMNHNYHHIRMEEEKSVHENFEN